MKNTPQHLQPTSQQGKTASLLPYLGPLLLSALLLGCGSNIVVYQWQQATVGLLNLTGNTPLNSGATVDIRDFALRVDLSHEVVSELSNSDFFAGDGGFQSNDRITRITIRSTGRLVEGLPTDSLLNRFFLAIPTNGNLRAAQPINEFIRSFGRLSPQIDEGFLLIPAPNVRPVTRQHRFTVEISLSRGGLLSAQSGMINLD